MGPIAFAVVALSVVAVCLLLPIVIGLLASWNRQVISEDYFLAGRSLPWYAVALGVVGAGFGLEYLVGIVAVAYSVGMAAAGFGWGNLLAYTVLTGVFLPFFYRKKLYSTTEFLERRYSRSTRGVFAFLVLPTVVLGVLAPALYAAGWVLCQAGAGHQLDGVGVDWQLALCIVVVALCAGAYSVSGGLMASVWASVVQMLVFIIGAVVFALVAMQDASSVSDVFDRNGQERMSLLLPLGDPNELPWTGILAFCCTLAVWNVGASPVVVQRCLGARSEWDARMGVIVAGFLKIVLTALIVLPALAVFKAAPLSAVGAWADRHFFTVFDAVLGSDSALGALAQGLVVAGVLAALMSAISAAVNAVSAVWTMDLCQDLWQKRDSEAEMVRRGRRSALITLVLGTILSPLAFFSSKGIFSYVLEVAAILGPPAAVIFLVAFLWPRAHGGAATATLLLGTAAGGLLWVVAEYGQRSVVPPWLLPVLNRAGVSAVFSLVVLGLATFIIPQNRYELYDPDTKWCPSNSRLPPNEQDLGSGPRSLMFWWAVMLVATIAVWVVFW